MGWYCFIFFPHVILVVWHFANLYGCLMIACWPIPSASCTLNPTGARISLSSKSHFYFTFLMVKYNCPLSKCIFTHCNINEWLLIQTDTISQKMFDLSQRTVLNLIHGSLVEAAASFGFLYLPVTLSTILSSSNTPEKHSIQQSAKL